MLYQWRKIWMTSVTCAAVMLTACQNHQMAVKPAGDWEPDQIASQEDKTYYHKGKQHLASREYGLAMDAFLRDLSLRGKNIDSLNGLAIAYDRLGRYDISQRYYKQALALQPTSPVTLSNLAYSQYKQGDYDNAMAIGATAQTSLCIIIIQGQCRHE